MPRELKDIDISYVSLVDKAANKKKFLLMKNENSFILETKAFINKSDEEKHLVYGIVYEPDTLDSDGDYATAESIEKAAHSFMMNHRNVDIQHNFEKREDIKIAESYIAPTDLVIGEQNIKKGTWLMVTKVENEDIWKSAKEGNFTGFSMAGSAITVQKSKEAEKDLKESYEKNKALDNIQQASFKDKFLNIFKKEEKKEVQKMDEKQIQELIAKSVGDALAKSEAEKKAELEKSEAKTKSEEELNATIAKAVEDKLKDMGIEKAEETADEIKKKKIAELEKELAELKKARKTSNSLDTTVQKSDNNNGPNYLKSFM